MKNFYQHSLLATVFFLLIGCQTTSTPVFFSSHSSDEALTASVSETLRMNNELANIPVQVEAHKGRVALSGYVKTIRQSDTAGDIAAKVPGVKEVENNLIVRK